MWATLRGNSLQGSGLVRSHIQKRCGAPMHLENENEMWATSQYIKFNAMAELRKFLRGRKTKVDTTALLCVIGCRYLDMLKRR